MTETPIPVQREPFDYQAWRERQFGGMSLEVIFRQMEQAEAAAG